MSDQRDDMGDEGRSADGARPQHENDGGTLLPGGEPGVKDDHPVGTTTGTGVGATVGAVIGTAVAGPAGTVVGAIIGGIVGGGAGHGIAEAVTGDEGDGVGVDRDRDLEVVERPTTTAERFDDTAPVGVVGDGPHTTALEDDVLPGTAGEDRPERR